LNVASRGPKVGLLLVVIADLDGTEGFVVEPCTMSFPLGSLLSATSSKDA